MKPSTVFKLFSGALLFSPLVADALEIPVQKVGLWEMRSQHSYDGAAVTQARTTQLCLAAADMESAVKMTEEFAKKSCSKNEVRKEGGKWIGNGVCKAGGTIISTQTTREYSGENAYHDVIDVTYDPPLNGHSRSHTVMDGKWLGTCK